MPCAQCGSGGPGLLVEVLKFRLCLLGVLCTLCTALPVCTPQPQQAHRWRISMLPVSSLSFVERCCPVL